MMLAVSSYSAEHRADVRQFFAHQIATYETIGPSAEFAEGYFRSLVLALDRCFVHRQRSLEGKDGNPLNELRMLCDSIVNNSGVLTSDKSIKYRPESSITGLSIGSRISLDKAVFLALADGVLQEIQQRFPSGHI